LPTGLARYQPFRWLLTRQPTDPVANRKNRTVPRATKPEFKVSRAYNAIRVTFDGLLHLHVRRNDLIGVHSWIHEAESKWFIEFTFERGKMKAEYDSEKKWRSILTQLADAL
jgi:hypothetical protein